jgi:hypothetical protein
VPRFVPCLPQKWLSYWLFKGLDCRLLCLCANVAVAFEHLSADVPGQGSNRFFAHVRIFGEAGNEGVPQIVPPLAEPCVFQGN